MQRRPAFVAAALCLAAGCAAGLPAAADDLRDPAAACRAEGRMLWEDWVAELLVRNPGMVSYVPTGAARDRLLMACGCYFPGADCPPEHVEIFYQMGRDRVLVAFAKRGCAVWADEIATERLTDILYGRVRC